MYLAALTGLLVGGGYGYVSQRGAFCMNSGFRMVVTERNTTKVKSYVLAIALQMLVVPAVFAVGLSSPTYPSMFPIGAVLGGLLFGASMRWAGGCAAGVWYKIGSGSLGALIAVLGMAVGATAFELGPFAAVRTAVQSAGP
ncbi:MAG: YeeE/YedE family protein [Myxococcales bacterium]|nr:YeeE/YedE family protein [Deltaproteobacteria bacterium]NND28853.1 YeeE/YedE family protein [Myxococcales bacterium]